MTTRRISTIVLIVMFIAVQSIVYGENEQPCQPDVVVMFGNGVWNDAEDAEESRELLEDALEIHVLGTDLEGIIEYDTSHNPSEGTLLDLLETFEQTIQTNYSKFWKFLSGLDLMPDILQDKLKEIAIEVNADIVSANPSVQEHIAVYDLYLREGNVVVLVAHSQGNLYGNIAYLGLDRQYIDGFGIVSVANPDSYVADNGPYTTIDEDNIIFPLQFVYPYALPPNLDNFFGPVNLNDWSGHKFIESYMASGHDAEIIILDNVVSMINDLRLRNRRCGLPDTGQWQDFTPIFGEDSDYTIHQLSYTDNGDGTVTDNNTGLMWQQADDGIERTWGDAISYCSTLSLAGYTDWRLPEIQELTDIVNYGLGDPAIDTTFFPNTETFYWSSTTNANDIADAWYVWFRTGFVGNTRKVSNYNVRCVRGGQ